MRTGNFLPVLFVVRDATCFFLLEVWLCQCADFLVTVSGTVEKITGCKIQIHLITRGSMSKPKFLHFVVQYRSCYRGTIHDFEIDAVSAEDAMKAFLTAVMLEGYVRRLPYKFHSVVGVKVKEETNESGNSDSAGG